MAEDKGVVYEHRNLLIKGNIKIEKMTEAASNGDDTKMDGISSYNGGKKDHS